MNVEVWCRSLAVLPGQPPRHAPVLSWDDPVSGTPRAALEKAWSLTNANPERLDGWEAGVRSEWDRVAGGLSLGVGDVVVVDGTRYSCVTGGFVPEVSP